jgi:uroporphyrin-III C-methyltransferase/precorrin-2 dehydrogenase/sirohydrochlorin ferrochelatase
MSAPVRRPGERPASRIAALARLPVFLVLEGKRAVVAGDAAAVAWKAELLSAAGAAVDVFAERPCEELRAVAAQAPRGAIALRCRAWRDADLSGAAVAVGGFDDDDEAKSFAAAVRAVGVPVNVIDRPTHSDFAFGAIVNRSPLVIAISTAGAAPVLAQAIRARIEAVIPHGFARWVTAAQRWREAVQSSGLSFAARLRLWQAFARLAFAHPEREPAQPDMDALLRDKAAANVGALTLIGTSAGDPELLTLRALRALQSADVVVIDGLVAPDILDFARREARKIVIGSSAHNLAGDQDDGTTAAIAAARAGGRVAWLTADPVLSSRIGAAIGTCRAAGIAVEVIPEVGVVDPPHMCIGSAASGVQCS